MKTTFLNYECDVEFNHYGNGRTAIQLWVWDGDDYREPMCTATINLQNEAMAPDEVIIKDYSENAGIVESLVAAGVIRTPHRYVSSGFVEKIPVCWLTDEAIKEVNKCLKKDDS